MFSKIVYTPLILRYLIGFDNIINYGGGCKKLMGQHTVKKFCATLQTWVLSDDRKRLLLDTSYSRSVLEKNTCYVYYFESNQKGWFLICPAHEPMINLCLILVNELLKLDVFKITRFDSLLFICVPHSYRSRARVGLG